jgi:glycerol kinase
MHRLEGLKNQLTNTAFTMVGQQEVFVGSIDQGTTSSRFLIFNKSGDPIASHQIEFKQIYPQPG